MTDAQLIRSDLAQLNRMVRTLVKLKKWDEWLTASEVCRRYSISERTLFNMRRDGDLVMKKDFTCSKGGRKFRYKESSILKAMS